MPHRDARELDHKTLEEIRIRAVEQVQTGESPEAVIKALGFSRSCIYTWLALYRSGGWGALKARALKGRPMKISAAQMKWLYETVTGKNPLQFRFEFALWTREMIRMLLREEFSLKLSVTSVGRLLRQLGLSCQRPLFRATEQDPERVRRWRDEGFPTIRHLAKKAGAVILFGDEAGVRSDYHAGTTWGVKGKTPIVPRTGGRHSINMLSAVSARGELRFLLVRGRVNGVVFAEFLRRLMHNASHPVFLILDGHSIHRSRPVRDFIASQEGRLRLFFLPPYSPELNPDELAWAHVKTKIAKATTQTKTELKRMIDRVMRRLQKMPNIVSSFFHVPTCAYAKS